MREIKSSFNDQFKNDLQCCDDVFLYERVCCTLQIRSAQTYIPAAVNKHDCHTGLHGDGLVQWSDEFHQSRIHFIYLKYRVYDQNSCLYSVRRTRTLHRLTTPSVSGSSCSRTRFGFQSFDSSTVTSVLSQSKTGLSSIDYQAIVVSPSTSHRHSINTITRILSSPDRCCCC